MPVSVVGGLPPLAKIRAGYQHTCAIDNIGGVWCWGDNARGQIGIGTFSHTTTPFDVVFP